MAEVVIQNKGCAAERKMPAGISSSLLKQIAGELSRSSLFDEEEGGRKIQQTAKRLDVSTAELTALLIGHSPDIMAGLVSERRQKEIITSSTLRPLVILSAVEEGNIDIAVGVIKKALQYASPKAHCDHKELVAAVRDEVTQWRTAEKDGYAPLTANQKLFISIFDSQVMPNLNIWKVFRHFREDQHKILRSILGQYGESFGAQVIDELRVIFNQEPEALSAESKMVNSFLKTGYRGFSAKTYIAYREAYRHSPFEAQKLIREWSRISRSLLSGSEVSQELREHPLYDEFVNGAYRPTVFSGAEVEQSPYMDMHSLRKLIGYGTNESEHLARYRYPVAGYPMELSSESAVKIENNAHIERLQECAKLAGCGDGPEVTRAEAAREISRLLIGASSEVDKTKLLAFAIQRAGQTGELRELAESSRKRSMSGNDLQKIRSIRLLLGDAFEEEMDKALPEIVSEIRVNGKIANSVRRTMKLPPDAAVGAKELEALASVELPKIFNEELGFLGTLEKQIAPGTSGNYHMYLSKASHAFVARASAALCTTWDLWSWRNPNYLQMTMVDQDLSRIVGVIQLHVIKDLRSRDAIMARINPTEFFVDRVDKAALAKAMLTTIQQFADDNGLLVYLAEQGEYRMQTNRNSFLPFLEAYNGEKQRMEVQVTGREFQNVKAMFALRKDLLKR